MNSSATGTNNLILNLDFSNNLESWHPNSCEAKGYVVSRDNYAVITNRKIHWHGLEQDITGKAFPGLTYKVSASVGKSSPLQNIAEVQATLKLEYPDSKTEFFVIVRSSVSKGQWIRLEGSFAIKTWPDHVVFYLEGPPPGMDLLIESVVMSRACVI